ncbi:unnamed protein product [Rotaria sp. Silwood1]|nr:unnamed protein product [Rotaria sp. Silwood1]CAF1642023.1 unnamed protein product [Rotaria sp. Silwood1]
MKFELLLNEILLDLFDYFNGVDLLCIFYDLNYHFNSLLYEQYRSYRFNFNSISKHNFDIICSQHLSFITDRIISLSLFDDENTPGQINLFRFYIPSFSQFTQLQSLYLLNIQKLEIQLPINNQFWSIMSNLKRLYSLNVISYTDTYYSQLQILLDQAPNLDKLIIDQDVSLPFQLSLFKLTNITIRKLHLDYYYYCFNEEKCILLCHSLLGTHCQVLYIRVLFVKLTYEKTSEYFFLYQTEIINFSIQK